MGSYEQQYIGKTLNGKYLIKELVGCGGMSYVFKAEIVGTGEPVSVKILNEESAKDEKAVKRFVNESKAVSMLSHKNIVKIYDVAFESDINYLVMEYVDGITLKEYIDYKKVVDWKESAYYVSQILKALGHAHSKGIIHRDVKPQNVMITRDGVIKVMDFGIAKMLKSESITMTDMALGTVDYISPEQASGKEVGFYSDIYSVGVMLYEMTTGALPFVADSPMAVAMKQLQDDPVPPSEINPELPRGLEQIILKAMSKEPDERFSSCLAMDKALELVMGDPSMLFVDRSHSAKNASKKNKSGEKKKSSFLPIIAGVTISFFLVAVAVAANVGVKFYKTQFAVTGEDIRIPNLIGKVYNEELKLQLENDRFEVLRKYGTYDPKKSTGEIIAQNPDGGTTRKLSNANSSCQITLTVNPEPSKIVIDDYTNSSAQAVRTQLTKLGLSGTVVPRSDDTVIEGYIISTDPAPGTVVEKGTTVTLYVSSGAALKTTKVPKLIGLSVDEAKKALQANDISIGEITYEDSELPAGTVISASHAENETIPKKIVEVELYVSLGNLVRDIPDETPQDNEDPESENGGNENENEGGGSGNNTGDGTGSESEGGSEGGSGSGTGNKSEIGENGGGDEVKDSENPPKSEDPDTVDEGSTEI